MESCYPVYWNQKTAGQVTVTKEGLYYRFNCQVQLPPDSRCRLYACTGEENRDLGLFVPDGDNFVLQTRVPVKCFEKGEYRFSLDQPAVAEFIPVYSDEPFPVLDRLEGGKFASYGDKQGIVFAVKDRSLHNF